VAAMRVVPTFSRASVFVCQLRRSISSHSRVAKTLGGTLW
jgi:hypothetical protein